MDINKRIGESIKRIRKERNLNQEEMGELLNLSRQAISKWENGDHKYSINDLEFVCDKLCVTMDYLLQRSKTNNKESKETIIADLFGVSNESSKRIVEFFLSHKPIPILMEQYINSGIISLIVDSINTLSSYKEAYNNALKKLHFYSDELSVKEENRLKLEITRLSIIIDLKLRIIENEMRKTTKFIPFVNSTSLSVDVLDDNSFSDLITELTEKLIPKYKLQNDEESIAKYLTEGI